MKMIKKNILILSLVLIITMFVNWNMSYAAGEKPISQTKIGDVVRFGDMQWLVVNPKEGLIVLRNNDGNKSWDNSSNDYSTSDIRNYLNTEFLSKFNSGEKALIQNSSWNVGSETNESRETVTDKIGLLTKSEYESVRGKTNFPHGGEGYFWWLITSRSSSFDGVWCVNSDGFTYNRYAGYSFGVRPALHLKSNVRVSSNNTVVTTPPRPSLTANSVIGSTEIDITINSNYAGSGLSYYLERATNSSFTENKVVLKNWVSSSTYSDTGLSANTTYYYRAKTKLNLTGNKSSFSSVVNRTSNPDKVTNLSISTSVIEWYPTDPTGGRIKTVLSWDNPGGGATGYFVDVHDGETWREFDVGNVTTWDSSEAKIYPEENIITEIPTGTRTDDIFYHNKGGLDLRDDPRNLYRSAKSNIHNNIQYYMFRVRAYGINGKEYYGPAVEIHSPVTSAVDSSPIVKSVNTVDGNAKITETKVDLNISAIALGSGLKGIYINDQPDMTGSTYYSWPTQGQTSGTMNVTHNIGFQSGVITLYVQAETMTGLKNTNLGKIDLFAVNDITPPTVKPTINSGDEFTTDPNISLTLEAFDDFTNVNDLKMRYSFDGTNWEPSNNNWDDFQFMKDINIPFQPTNTTQIVRVFVQVKDTSGNIGNGYASIKYVDESKLQEERLLARQLQDTEKPRIIGLGLASGGSVSTNNRVNFSFGVEDNATLPENIKIYASADGVNWEDKGLYSGSVDYNFNDSGYKFLYIKAVDEAGNYCIEDTRFFIL